MLEKVFSSFILFSVAAGCFMTMVEVNKSERVKRINLRFQAQERNGPRPRHVVEDANCKYSFSPSGQCYIEYEGPKRPGVITGESINMCHCIIRFTFNFLSGSCLPLAYGGECFNVPPECRTCQDIEVGDAIQNLAGRRKKFLSKFLNVKF